MCFCWYNICYCCFMPIFLKRSFYKKIYWVLRFCIFQSMVKKIMLKFMRQPCDQRNNPSPPNDFNPCVQLCISLDDNFHQFSPLKWSLLLSYTAFRHQLVVLLWLYCLIWIVNLFKYEHAKITFFVKWAFAYKCKFACKISCFYLI